MTKQKFKPGDVVNLKSGGPDMTVKCYEPKDSIEVVCTWFGPKGIEERAFPQDLLELEQATDVSDIF